MAKEMVYFNATKQVDTITFHYNGKLDGGFVDDVVKYIKEIAGTMSKVNLKQPKEFESIQVFIYPSRDLFNQIFGEEIRRRIDKHKRSEEDLHMVKDSEGNIHILSPRGNSITKRDALKQILVRNVLSEYVDEKKRGEIKAIVKEKFNKEKDIEEKKQDKKDEVEEELEEQESEIEEVDEEEISEEEVEEILSIEDELNEIDNVENEIDTTTETEVLEAKSIEEKEAEKEANDRNKTKFWLKIGWFAYVNGKLKKEKDIEMFRHRIRDKGVTKLGSLKDSKFFEDYNFSEEYACATVEYIIETYGKKKFVELYENPKDIKGVLGISKLNFNNQVKAYIYSKYGEKEMLMEMDKRGIKEITAIHVEKSGGTDITTYKEEKMIFKEEKVIE